AGGGAITPDLLPEELRAGAPARAAETAAGEESLEAAEGRHIAAVRGRLRLGLGAIAVALALLSAAAVLSLNRLGGAVATILKENYASVIACEEMKEALERLDS